MPEKKTEKCKQCGQPCSRRAQYCQACSIEVRRKNPTKQTLLETDKARLCACGCGGILRIRSDGNNQQYLKGHNPQGVKVKTVCAQCKTPIQIPLWRINTFGAQNVYCSRSCQKKARSIAATSTFPCDNCGISISAINSMKKGNHRFCSLACASIFKRGKRKGNPVICDQCGTSFYKPPSVVAISKHHFCSTTCRALFITGENNPAYTTGMGRHPLYGASWKRQRRLARIRDNDTCQICQSKPTRLKALHVHHITPAHMFFGDWEQANNLRNLICLCSTCHSAVEAGKLSL